MSGDVLKRLAAHNSKAGGARFTKGKGPWKLVYVQIMPSKSEALKREYQIKQMSRIQKLRLAQTLGTTAVIPIREDPQGE
jgi:putative endonuclease